MSGTGAVRWRQPVELIRFSRWVCRACVVADAVLLGLLVAGALGWAPSADVVAGVGAVVMVGVLAVFVRLRSVTRLAYPAGFAAGPDDSSAAPKTSVGEDRAGWSSWSTPTRAEAVGRARVFRDLTAALERGGPVAPSDRAAAGVHAYRQVATYTNGAAGNSLLLAVASLQLVQRDSLGWPYVAAVLLLAAAVLFVVNFRGARRWRRIAGDHELVEPPRET